MILSCKDIYKSFGSSDILKNISFIMEENEKVAIVGVNGAGKTTLFKIIAGELEPDVGEVILKKDCILQHMHQSVTVTSQNSIYEEMESVFSDIIHLESNIREMETKMALLQGTELEELMKRYSRSVHEFETKDGYQYKSRIKGVISGLGFKDSDYNKKIDNLSGGEKTRVSLGKILLQEPDLLLLDEPTNHLDLEAINWLETFLANYNKSVIIISHDRYFLDKTVTKIIEIENTKSYIYYGNYSDYAIKKEINRNILLKTFLDQQKEIKRQEEVIKLLKSFNREKSIKRAESREKLLAKMERVEKPEDLPDLMHFSLVPSHESGEDVLSVEDVSKKFGERTLFKNVSFHIKKGEKVALIGPNGVGKTTLLKIIRNLLEPDSGKIKFGTNVVADYYDQEQQNLNLSKTIFDEIYDSHPNLTVTKIRNTLAAFVFTGDDVFKTLQSLSGGEIGRVALAKIMLGSANFLLLDEPTNHLDMFSKEILEQALNSYEGTVLYISHDRYFINNTADKIIEINHEKINTYYGNFDYYLQKKEEETSIIENNPQLQTTTKKDYIQKKEEIADDRRKKSLLLKYEKDIESLEINISKLNEQLEKEEVYTNPTLAHEVYSEKEKLDLELIDLYNKWEELS